MEPIRFTAKEDNIKAMKLFIGETKRFLNEIVHQEYKGTSSFEQVSFVKELLPLMKKAWKETIQLFNFLSDTLALLKFREILIINHGLSGKSLEFKFNVINHHIDLFNINGGIYYFKNLIKAIDILLESIISAANTITGGAIGTGISEMKDYIGLSTQDIKN